MDHQIPRRSVRRLPTAPVILLAWLLVAGLVSVGPLRAHEPSAGPAPVKLVIDYGDGAQRVYPQISWRKGLTVLDTLQYAQRHPRGIEFAFRGKKATALLYKIDDLANQGGSGRNWIYRINGQLADRSFAVFLLQPGDTVLWKFENYP